MPITFPLQLQIDIFAFLIKMQSVYKLANTYWNKSLIFILKIITKLLNKSNKKREKQSNNRLTIYTHTDRPHAIYFICYYHLFVPLLYAARLPNRRLAQISADQLGGWPELASTGFFFCGVFFPTQIAHDFNYSIAFYVINKYEYYSKTNAIYSDLILLLFCRLFEFQFIYNNKIPIYL